MSTSMSQLPPGLGGNFSGGNSGAGSNQYFGITPSMPNPWGSSPSGGVFSGGDPSRMRAVADSSGGGNTQITIPGFNNNSATTGLRGKNELTATTSQGGGLSVVNQLYPGLGNNFANMLNSQIGQGLPGYNGQVALPTGGTSDPGSLTAGMNPLLTQLMQYFQTGQGGNMPGMSNLSNIANNGVSALPEWQSMIQAQQQNIGQNQANLKEQFAGMGDLAGSPFGTAMSNYMQQTTLDQNSLLGQLQQQNIQNIQMPAIQSLFQGSQSMAGGLQSLDQSAIDRMYQQFQTDLPQNNPLLPYMSGYGSLFPPTAGSQSGSQEFGQIAGGIGELGQAVGSIMQGAAACPVEGSMILMADGSLKPVEQLVQGDEIMGVDDEPCVVDIVPKVYEDIVDVYCENGSHCRNSLSHTFVLPRGGFAIALKSLGCVISTVEGPSRITRVERSGKAFVYDILTDGSHTYCADGVWAQGGEVVNGMVVTEEQVAAYR